MQKNQRWVYLILALALLNCGEKSPSDRNNSAAQKLNSDVSQLAQQFDADSAMTRLVLLLSPT
jgi:hypothetical protein